MTRLDIVEQRLKRNSRADKYGSSAHDFRIAVHYGLSHDPHSPQRLLKKNTSVSRPEPTLPENRSWRNGTTDCPQKMNPRRIDHAHLRFSREKRGQANIVD